MILRSPDPSWDLDDESRRFLADILRRDGVDLMESSPHDLARGTPVYVEAPCDPIKVLSQMARGHVRFLPVLLGDKVLDLLNRIDLSRRIRGSRVPNGCL